MLKTFRTKAVALAASVSLLGGVAWIAAGTTGAYFSDTNQGDISGTIGSILIDTSGGSGAEHANFSFANMLPGEAQTAVVGYKNTGANNEDVYIVFNNATALSALNNLGAYGEAHLKANGAALFDSANLHDATTCGTFSPAPGQCWPLAKEYKVASNVAPNEGGTVSFTFNYAGTLKGQAPVGTTAAFNSYPATGPDPQTTVNATDGIGAGLPYQIVATQVGITPGK